MGEVSNGLSAEQVAAMIPKQTTPFVNSGNSLTITDLLANFPASASIMGQYARVSDLYGSVDDILRCRFDGVAYRWIPQREAFNQTLTAPTGVISIRPLFSPPTIKIEGTLTGSVNATPVATNAWIGLRNRLVMAGVLGLGASLSLTGLVGGALPILAGGVKDIEYGPSGWFVVS